MIQEKEITPEDILNELNQFTGTEAYYKASNLYDLNLTDGVQFLRLKLNCFWLIDIIGSVQYLKRINQESFILWKIKVFEDRSYSVTAYSDYDSEKTEKENLKYLLYDQYGDYTDFLLKEFEFYQINNILLLKSEY